MLTGESPLCLSDKIHQQCFVHLYLHWFKYFLSTIKVSFPKFVAAIVCSILGSVFTSDNTYYRKISRSCELARLDVKCSYRLYEISCDMRMIRVNISLNHKNRRGKSIMSWRAQAFVLRNSDPEMLPKLKADWNIVYRSHAFNTLRDILIRRLMGYWNGPQIPVWRNDKNVVYWQSKNYLL